MKTMTELEQIILQAQDAYYNGTPLMSDADFDELYDKLIAEQPDSEILKRVGVDNSDGFEKVNHKITMGSQNKANTLPEMEKWLKKINGNIVATHKMDGASICLTYEKGKLVDAVTRGNGCLEYNTILKTDLGDIPIGKIVEDKVQCKVLSYDLNEKKKVWVDVESFFINKNAFDWYELELEDGKKITLTENHQVFVTNKNKFVKVSELSDGDDFVVL